MTNDYDKLHAMQACAPALRWVGTRTITEAWRDCERSDWMCWLLERIAPWDPRLRLAAADMAERVWDLIPAEPTRLAAAWAIGAARRGNEDEMRTAAAAACDASTYDAYAYEAESAAQADILREYFSAREISDLFRRAPA